MKITYHINRLPHALYHEVVVRSFFRSASAWSFTFCCLVMIAFKGSNATSLHLFLEQAKEKDFPLHYTTMDCALRGYGAFIVWLHFVMYLIFRHIHREDDYSTPYEEDEEKEYTNTPRTEVATPKQAETPAKTAKRKSISSRKSKASSKKKRGSKKMNKSKKSKNRSHAEGSPENSYRVDKTQKFGNGTAGLHVVAHSRENAEEERPELMKKFLAENDVSSPEKQISIKDLPLWILLTDRAKNDDAGNETRLLMVDWLLRRGGMDLMPPFGAPKLPRTIPSRDVQATQMLPAFNIPHLGRAPKGEQTERLANMEQFLEKIGSGEKASAEKVSAERGSAEKGSNERLSAEVVDKEDETQTVTEKEKKSMGEVLKMVEPMLHSVEKTNPKEEAPQPGTERNDQLSNVPATSGSSAKGIRSVSLVRHF
ncbi:hypothetical protein Y032_0230g2980 [Ancylostoma ceylanicum]|uniref:Uncharacterized protein n=1 Tax=Ancylostoma ceylanicum TaxID=53326 RepID=A0A016SH40_9BILA|nr:hypothetical protein Y032_0230g2980 [Ancylostoma ceylanicum]